MANGFSARFELHNHSNVNTSYVDIVFSGPPDHHAPSFIEVEDDQGASIRFGEWVDRKDGTWALRITVPNNLQP